MFVEIADRRAAGGQTSGTSPGQPGRGTTIRRHTWARSPRVLFAEDNATNQFVARQMLKDLDIHLDVAANGAEAVEAASRIATM